MKKSLSEICDGLKGLGLPVTYYEWKDGKAPDLPFIVYYEEGKNPFFADNKNYYTTHLVTVELYTDYKDEKLESLLEAFFNSQNITLSLVEEAYWSDERLHEVSYEFEI